MIFFSSLCEFCQISRQHQNAANLQKTHARTKISCLIHDLKLNWLMINFCVMMCCTVDSMAFVPKIIHGTNVGLLLEFLRFLRTIIDVSVNKMTNAVENLHRSSNPLIFHLWFSFYSKIFPKWSEKIYFDFENQTVKRQTHIKVRWCS